MMGLKKWLFVTLILTLLIFSGVFAEGGTTFSITLNSPPNQTTTDDSTPDFNFTVSGTESSYSCELLINDTGYGTSTANNNTPTIITANQSLSDGTYNWYIKCWYSGGSGEEYLDYSQPTMGSAKNLGDDYWGQIFTTSHAGNITQVSVRLYRYSTTDTNVTFELWNVSSNDIPDTCLGSLGHIHWEDVGQTYAWHNLTVVNQLTVQNNTRYAIIWHSAEPYAAEIYAATFHEQGRFIYSTDNSSWKIGKQYEIKTYVDNSLDYSKTTYDTAESWVLPTVWKALPWTPSSSGQLTNISMIIYLYSGHYTNVTFELWSSDSNGHPDSQIQVLGTIPYTDLDSSYSWRQLDISSPPSVTAGTKYFIVVHHDDRIAVRYGYDTVDFEESSDSGTTWKDHDNPIKVYITESQK